MQKKVGRVYICIVIWCVINTLTSLEIIRSLDCHIKWLGNRPLSKYHGCWWPGSACRQVISSHGIDIIQSCCDPGRWTFHHFLHVRRYCIIRNLVGSDSHHDPLHMAVTGTADRSKEDSTLYRRQEVGMLFNRLGRKLVCCLIGMLVVVIICQKADQLVGTPRLTGGKPQGCVGHRWTAVRNGGSEWAQAARHWGIEQWCGIHNVD